MAVSRLIVGVSAVLLTAAVSGAIAQSVSMPPRQGGEWETTMSGMGAEGRTFTAKVCVNPATEHAFLPGSMGHRGPGDPGGAARQCSKEEAHPIAGGYAFNSECPSYGGGVTRTSGTIIGDFRTHLHMEIDTSNARGNHHMVMDQRWVSPTCAAGPAGNTITLPDGRVITIPPH